jgi:preprotein translocase subunit SecD
MKLWPVLLLIAAACSSGDGSRPTDIRNGMRLVYALEAAADDRPVLEQTVRVVGDRLARAKIIGTAKIAGDKLEVDLAPTDADRLQRARELIARTARLDLYAADTQAAYMRELYAHVRRDPHAVDTGIRADAETRHVGSGPRTWYYLAGTDSARVEAYVDALSRDGSLPMPPERKLVFEPAGAAGWRTHLVERTPRISAPTVTDAKAQLDPEMGRPNVTVTLDAAGARAFAQLTRQITGDVLVMVIDDRVINAPTVISAIEGGKLWLSLDNTSTLAQARDLATALASGPLPAPLRLESVNELRAGAVVQTPP